MTIAERLKAAFKIVFPSGGTAGGPRFFIDSDTGIERWLPARGSRVDYSTVDGMLSSIVMACVNSVTRVFPEARLRVMRPVADGEVEEIPDHDAARLTATPNEHMSADEFWQATNVDYDVRGNAYWLKLRDRGRRVAELFPLPAALVRARWPRDGSEWISYYELWTGRAWVRIEAEDIVHFRNGIDWSPGSDGRYGLSPLRPVMRDIYADEESGNYTSAILRNAGVVGAIFSPAASLFQTPKDGTPFVLTDDDVAAMRAEYTRSYGGDNRGLPLMFTVPMDVSKFAFSPADMTLDKINLKAEARISSLLNVPAIVAGLQVGLERSTYSNTEQAMRALWSNNIVPRQRAFTGKLNAQLLPDFGPDGAFFAFDNSQVEALQESRADRDTRAARLFMSTTITRNEARARAGEPPLDGPEGDAFYAGPMAAPGAGDAASGLAALQAAAVRGYLVGKADDAPTAGDWPEVRRLLDGLGVEDLGEHLDPRGDR